MPAATKKTPVVAVKKPVAAKVPVIKAADAVKPAPVQKIEEPVKPETVQPAAPQENVLQGIVEKVNIVVTMGKELQSQLKVLSKEWDKQQKIIDKVQKKRQNAKNSPSGFAKPNKISNELCDFIGEPHGTEKSRTDITRFINAYIKEHNLNKPENKRFIIPDEKLRKILNVDAKEEINYFILQKLISHHFPPSASKLAAAAAAAAK
jgi:upstream activation factor subunit UAF30